MSRTPRRGVARAAPDAARGTRRGTPWGGSDNDPRHPGALLVDTPMSRLRHASRPADRPLVAMPPQAGNPGSLPIRARPKIDRSSTGPRPFHRDPDTAPRPSRPTPATARRRPPPSRPARRQPLLVLGAHAQRHAQAPLAVARRRVHRQHPVLCIRRAPCRQPTTSMPSMSAPVCPPRPLPHTCTSLTAPARRAQPDRPPRLRPNLVHRRRLAVDALAARPGAQLRPRRVGAHTHSTTPAGAPRPRRNSLTPAAAAAAHVLRLASAAVLPSAHCT